MKLNQKKKKKKKMGRPIKAHRIWRPVNRSNRETTFKPSDFFVKTPVTGQTESVNRSNRSVYQSEPVTHVLLNLDLNSIDFYRFPVKPIR